MVYLTCVFGPVRYINGTEMEMIPVTHLYLCYTIIPFSSVFFSLNAKSKAFLLKEFIKKMNFIRRYCQEEETSSVNTQLKPQDRVTRSYTIDTPSTHRFEHGSISMATKNV